jgi:hypothetical protein
LEKARCEDPRPDVRVLDVGRALLAPGRDVPRVREQAPVVGVDVELGAGLVEERPGLGAHGLVHRHTGVLREHAVQQRRATALRADDEEAANGDHGTTSDTR